MFSQLYSSKNLHNNKLQDYLFTIVKGDNWQAELFLNKIYTVLTQLRL